MQHDQDDDEANNDLHGLRKRGKPRGQILIQVERHVGWHSRQMLKNASGGCGRSGQEWRKDNLCVDGRPFLNSVLAATLLGDPRELVVDRR